MALDLGAKRVGLAVSDGLCITVRALAPLRRASWKQLLRDVIKQITAFDAQALVIGLPLRLDGGEGDAAAAARRIAENFARSLSIPVYLQDERLTSRAAVENLRAAGLSGDELRARVDSESALIILRDFIAAEQNSADAVKP